LTLLPAIRGVRRFIKGLGRMLTRPKTGMGCARAQYLVNHISVTL
jgi:hypothetical protein